MTRRALITGVTGQDGAYLAKFLLNKGYTVVGTTRDVRATQFGNLEVLGIRNQVVIESMAIHDFRGVLEVLRKVSPDEVYNMAGQSSVNLSFQQPRETLESIGMGTMNLLEGIRLADRPVRLFSAGSSECFGNTGTEAADEKTPFHPLSPYAVAKTAAFWEVANYRDVYGLYACTGILFNHESPLRSERFVTQKIVAAACRIARGSDEKLELGDISIQRDWGWAPEYVEAMWSMLQQERPDDYVIATGEARPLSHFVERTFSILGLNWREHVIQLDHLHRPADIPVSRGNPAKARAQLGWKACYVTDDVVRMMVKARLNLSRAVQ